jgi:long-chain acyl-CoA synthetase
VEELPKNATGKVLKRVLKEKVQAGGILRKK